MTNYRRKFVVGATYFFTVNLADRKSHLLVEHIGLLRDAFRYTRQRHPFTIDAIVVMPDHIHAIWTLPPDDSDIATRWRLIKTMCVRSLPDREHRSTSRFTKRERGIWQRRYWEHTIRDERDFAHHVDYIHFNPVKHGWVTHVADWPHSSFHQHVRLGRYPEDWGGTKNDNKLDYGEQT